MPCGADPSLGAGAAAPLLPGVMAMSTPANMSAKPTMPMMRMLQCDARDERADTGDGEQNAEHDRAVVGSTTTYPADRVHEVGIVAVEVALHLLEKTLLLL